MKVFISWSGTRSQAIAHALRDWLPDVLQTVEPFLSSADIEAGQRWSQELAEQLDKTSFGLVCVTADNQDAPWLNFEAGALAKALGASTVVPLLDDLKPTDLTGPLSQFQAKLVTREGLEDIVAAINGAMPAPLSDERLKRAVGRSWPELEEKLEHLRAARTESHSPRGDRDLLEEILSRVRDLGHTQTSVSESRSERSTVLRVARRITEEFPEATVALDGNDLDVTFPSVISTDVMDRVFEIGKNSTVGIAVGPVE